MNVIKQNIVSKSINALVVNTQKVYLKYMLNPSEPLSFSPVTHSLESLNMGTTLIPGV